MKKCILLVDDHPKVLKFLEIALKLREFDVVSTCSGREALELVRSEKPDIMLLDIIMPEMDGFEVIRQLRQFTMLPVIAVSASPESAGSALRLGANDFVCKPFDIENLLERIKLITGNSES